MRYLTSQEYLDADMVEAKRAALDYVVTVVSIPDLGDDVAMVVDGHHSLAAALRDGVEPVVVECVDADYLAGRDDLAAWLGAHQDGADYRWISEDGTLGTTVW